MSRCVTARIIPGPSDDTTTVMLRFESGATGLLFCSVATATNFAFTLYGSRGLAEISKPTLQSRALRADLRHAADRRGDRAAREITEHPAFDMLKAEMVAFAHAIRDRTPYPVPISDVLHGMAVFLAVVRPSRRLRAGAW